MTQETKVGKHTPGPWMADLELENSEVWGIFTEDEGYPLAYLMSRALDPLRAYEEDRANARLMADAPRLKQVNEQLLEALEALTLALTPWLYSASGRAHIDADPVAQDIPGAYAAGCLAIAEARGEVTA
jgi:hypothetical protein